MSDFTGDPIQAREDAYFQKQEQELREEVRRKAAREAAHAALMQALGIADPQVAAELAEEGFDSGTVPLLFLIPAVQVAWADGEIGVGEKQKILEIAERLGVAAGASRERLHGWLSEAPPERFFQAAIRAVRSVLSHRPAEEARALRRDLLDYCNRVAAASGGFLGIGPVSGDEESVLLRLGAEFAV